MELPLARPSNRFLVLERDRRWLGVLGSLLVLAVLVATALFLVGWPRLASTTLHYDLVRLRAEVAETEREVRTLEVELERERNPDRLAARAEAIGMVPPDPPELADGAAR